MKTKLSLVALLLSTASLLGEETNAYYYQGGGTLWTTKATAQDSAGWAQWNGSAWDMSKVPGYINPSSVIYFRGTDTGKNGFINSWTQNTDSSREGTYSVVSTANTTTEVITAYFGTWNVDLGVGGTSENPIQRDLFITGHYRSQGLKIGNKYTFNVDNLNVVSGTLGFKYSAYYGLYGSPTDTNVSRGGRIDFVSNNTVHISSNASINFGSTQYDNTAGKVAHTIEYTSSVILGTLGSSSKALQLESGASVSFATVESITINNKIDAVLGSNIDFKVFGSTENGHTGLTFKDTISALGTVSFGAGTVGKTDYYPNYTGQSSITFQALKNGIIFGNVDFVALNLKDGDGNYLVNILFEGLNLLSEVHFTTIMSWDELTVGSLTDQDASNLLLERASEFAGEGRFIIEGNSLRYAIPEPSEIALLLGLISLGFIIIRKRKRS